MQGRTEVITDPVRIIETIARFQAGTKKIWNACVEASLPAFSVGKVKEGYLAARARGVNIAYITEINSDNLTFCEELMQFTELRHLDGVRGNFALSETEYVAGIMEGRDIVSLVRTDVKEIVLQQQLIFLTLWGCSVPAMDRMAELK